MAPMKKMASRMLGLAIVLWVTACGTFKPEPNSWTLPKKENTNVGMIIGRIDFPNNKTENPENLVLNVQTVEFVDTAQVVKFGDAGETHYIMANNYFVVPNLKPGTYRLNSFRVGNNYHGMYYAKGYTYDIKPGQIKYIGSFDYVQYERSFMQALGNSFSYSLRKSPRPTEAEMLRWLYKTSAGSGWEPAIKRRLVELGERS